MMSLHLTSERGDWKTSSGTKRFLTFLSVREEKPSCSHRQTFTVSFIPLFVLPVLTSDFQSCCFRTLIDAV